MSTMDVELGVEQDEAVLRFAGELDLAVSDDMAGIARMTLEREGLARLVIDLTKVTFLDSSGVTALVRVKERATDLGVAILLRGAAPNVSRVFALTGLAEFFGLPAAEPDTSVVAQPG